MTPTSEVVLLHIDIQKISIYSQLSLVGSTYSSSKWMFYIKWEKRDVEETKFPNLRLFDIFALLKMDSCKRPITVVPALRRLDCVSKSLK